MRRVSESRFTNFVVRPRRESDETVLQRIAAALGARDAVGPWTLVEIGPAAGLSPAGLVKRFGSRKGVLEALSRRWIDAIPEGVSGRMSPHAELQAWVADRFSSRQGAAQQLGQLVEDLTDDDLRGMLLHGWSREQAYLAAILTACELPRLRDPAAGAATLFDALNGAGLRAAAGGGQDAVTQTLDTLLETWT